MLKRESKRKFFFFIKHKQLYYCFRDPLTLVAFEEPGELLTYLLSEKYPKLKAGIYRELNIYRSHDNPFFQIFTVKHNGLSPVG